MKFNIKNIYQKFIISLIFITILLSSLTSLANDVDFLEDANNNNPNIKENQIIKTYSNNEKQLNLNSRSCIVLDRTSKQILFGKNEYNKVKMASTTKIMTAIIVIENDDLTKTVEISKKAANTGGSRLGLKTGDKITIHDLLYGLMLCSGNDAAVALAECTAGSIPDFSELMNKKASELGLQNSHFESPHGLDSDGHYTTAYELAKLADYTLNNKTFSQIVGTKTYTVIINGNSKNLSNTNELLGNLNGVYGIKTGFTNGANRCLVTACKRDDMDIICVVLGADTKKFRTKDSISLIEYTFNTFEHINIEEFINKEFEKWKTENLDNFTINKAIDSNLEIKTSKLEHPIIAIKKENINNISASISATQILSAPVLEGTSIGNIAITSNSDLIANTNIILSNSVKKKNIPRYLYDFIKNYNNIIYNISI